MSFDGVFINHLLKELSPNIINQRINKLVILNEHDFVMLLSNKKKLLYNISSNPNLHFTEMEIINSINTQRFYVSLKRLLENSVIRNIKQHNNDRVILLEIEKYDDLGYSTNYTLIFEAFGKMYNLIIVDADFIIQEVLKPSTLESNRLLINKNTYQFPITNKINPFKTSIIYQTNNYEGVSKRLYSEISFQNNLNIIKNKTIPILFKNNSKYAFYCFDLKHMEGQRIIYNTLSELLEQYFYLTHQENILNHEQKLLFNHINKEIIKANKKLSKQIEEKREAQINLNYEKIGVLLKSNLHLVKRGFSSITVNDYFNDNQEITIELDPLLSSSENLDKIFKKYKKAKRAISFLKVQIKETKSSLKYFEDLLMQIDFAKFEDLKEIMLELNIGKSSKKSIKHKRPNYDSYEYNDVKIFVGKNNIQNNYLTHTFAKKSDFFLHVKGIPGSHTILRGNEITEADLIFAAEIAALYSKAKDSKNIEVDYTLIKHVKKIPKLYGSYVSYKNQKTLSVTPNVEKIKDALKK
ncbi:MAG TPA: fibronectin-binding domain-containing protein [Acholeplasmataceae bacterium]|nr:fibronectin-binding domain-containing protein [Acholeplasmataceae bacterium]